MVQLRNLHLFWWSVILVLAFVSAMCRAGRVSKPSIVWVMADDLDNDWKDDRLAYMHNLRQRFREQVFILLLLLLTLPLSRVPSFQSTRQLSRSVGLQGHRCY